VFFEVIIDDLAIRMLSIQEIPVDWRGMEPRQARTLGTEWIKSESSVALVVPSVVIPDERNVLLNPAHPDFTLSVRILGPWIFEWDPRLFH
jgi:RES domain-containing protein